MLVVTRLPVAPARWGAGPEGFGVHTEPEFWEGSQSLVTTFVFQETQGQVPFPDSLLLCSLGEVNILSVLLLSS